MIITKDNIDGIDIKSVKENKELILALLDDLEDINTKTSKLFNKTFYINVWEYHTECSPEWTDPCPDYYGMFDIRDEQDEQYGIELPIEELDVEFCLFSNLIEKL